MKKLFIVLAAAFAMVACQTDINEVGIVADGVSAVEFEVGAPQMRSYSDGMTATELQYAVYEVKADKSLNYLEELTKAGDKAETLVNGTANVKLDLANNKKYAVIFWASAAVDAPYEVDFETKKVKVTYGGNCNDESRDAFYAYKEFEVKGAATLGVELRRPFAQVNVGTSAKDLADAAKSNFVPEKSTLVVKNVCNVLNLVTGEATGDVDATFAEANVPNVEVEEFPVAGYEYLAMSYVLVGNMDKSAHDVTYTIADGTTSISNTIGAVPMRANYRTNIYGKLLTSSTDINVEINPDYEGGYNENVPGVKIGETRYNTLAEAYAAAVDGDVLVLMGDQQISESFINTKNITLNLNGAVLSHVKECTASYEMIYNKGTLTIIDESATRTASTGKISFKDTSAGDPTYGWGSYTVRNEGTLVVNGGTIEHLGEQEAHMICAIFQYSGTSTINGGVISTPNYRSARLWMGDMTINGGTFEGQFWLQAVANSVSNLTINGGSFAPRGGDGSSVYVTNNQGTVTFAVNGGNFATKIGATDPSAEGVKGAIKGGVFTTAAKEGTNAALVADNCSYVESGEETWTVEKCYEEIVENDVLVGYKIMNAAGLQWIADAVNGDNTFEGKTVKLAADIDLFKGYMEDGDPISTQPIGRIDYTRDNKSFKGTFDGQGHTIKNLYQNGWALGYELGRYGAVGLFSRVEDATIKNLVIEGAEILVEGGNVSAVAANAVGNCTFENITIKNSQLASYENGVGGIVAWSEDGVYNFKNIKIESDVKLSGLWGDYDTTLGGVLAEAQPGATYNFENVEISCRIDAYNDCISSYQWYRYRMCGMVVGRCEEYYTASNGQNYPDLSKYNFSFKNVVVNYGDWMNYHYCVIARKNGWRVEPGYRYDGLPSNADHTTHAECCNNLIPFDQLIGGPQNGQHFCCNGLREVEGVIVNYPASYRREVSSAAALTEALGKGVSVILDTDIDFGSTQLAITGENQVVDLGGHILTTSNNWGGISLKNGAVIKNGTITHAGNTAAIKAFNGTSVENVTINATVQLQTRPLPVSQFSRVQMLSLSRM
ncbi:MAG: hypothetical protein IIX40_08645 [Alistipes sp.]|nr:hypothetical protein [Alistipes sp.]